ncbi:MAG: hypothetical protein M1828_007492 [Chrysothrix sp. TS-e1954]|nr:MAG: hypothetical protein M1828_007492 [Chrysothrix sp. TS-e1954]
MASKHGRTPSPTESERRVRTEFQRSHAGHTGVEDRSSPSENPSENPVARATSTETIPIRGTLQDLLAHSERCVRLSGQVETAERALVQAREDHEISKSYGPKYQDRKKAFDKALNGAQDRFESSKKRREQCEQQKEECCTSVLAAFDAQRIRLEDKITETDTGWRSELANLKQLFATRVTEDDLKISALTKRTAFLEEAQTTVDEKFTRLANESEQCNQFQAEIHAEVEQLNQDIQGVQKTEAATDIDPVSKKDGSSQGDRQLINEQRMLKVESAQTAFSEVLADRGRDEVDVDAQIEEIQENARAQQHRQDILAKQHLEKVEEHEQIFLDLKAPLQDFRLATEALKTRLDSVEIRMDKGDYSLELSERLKWVETIQERYKSQLRSLEESTKSDRAKERSRVLPSSDTEEALKQGLQGLKSVTERIENLSDIVRSLQDSYNNVTTEGLVKGLITEVQKASFPPVHAQIQGLRRDHQSLRQNYTSLEKMVQRAYDTLATLPTAPQVQKTLSECEGLTTNARKDVQGVRKDLQELQQAVSKSYQEHKAYVQNSFGSIDKTFGQVEASMSSLISAQSAKAESSRSSINALTDDISVLTTKVDDLASREVLPPTDISDRVKTLEEAKSVDGDAIFPQKLEEYASTLETLQETHRNLKAQVDENGATQKASIAKLEEKLNGHKSALDEIDSSLKSVKYLVNANANEVSGTLSIHQSSMDEAGKRLTTLEQDQKVLSEENEKSSKYIETQTRKAFDAYKILDGEMRETNETLKVIETQVQTHTTGISTVVELQKKRQKHAERDEMKLNGRTPSPGSSKHKSKINAQPPSSAPASLKRDSGGAPSVGSDAESLAPSSTRKKKKKKKKNRLVDLTNDAS